MFLILVRRISISFHWVRTDSFGLTHSNNLTLKTSSINVPFSRARSISPFSFPNAMPTMPRVFWRRQRALHLSNVLLVLKIGVRPLTRTMALSFRTDVLIAGRELAEAKVFWARARFAVVARDIRD